MGPKIETMIKKLVFITTLSVFLSACNMNPSKEERLQTLETEIKQSQQRIEALEARVQILETQNEALHKRLLEIQDQ
jgi:TolA-binding protein